jgi:16S rRNA G966 N2-methylase RsmD
LASRRRAVKFRFGLPYVDHLEFPRLFRVFRNDGVGRVIPVPLPVSGGRIFSFGRYLRALAKAKAWGTRTLPDGHLYVSSLDFEFTNFLFFSIMANEWDDWKNQYAPLDLRGKTVLDAGAACGDTAMFFISQGAKRVISVEPDSERFACLKRNVEAHGWPVEVLNRKLEARDLSNPEIDFAKIDIEESDKDLLKLDSLPPCAIETHWEEVTNAFVKKFGMRKLRSKSQFAVVTNVTPS